MQIAIDISEEDYKEVKTYGINMFPTVAQAIQNGTPLPKGHGRLIDEKDLSLTTVHLIDGVFVCTAPTIIPEDKEEGE